MRVGIIGCSILKMELEAILEAEPYLLEKWLLKAKSLTENI
jgi:hypothetical protein